MIVAITGASGFLGQEIALFYQKEAQLKLIQQKSFKNAYSAAQEIIPFDFLKNDINSLSNKLKDCDILFHCAYSPALSSKLPAELLRIYQKSNPKGKFVHFSSINVLAPALKEDPYTKSKIEAEHALFGMKPTIPVLVIHPSFLISNTNPGRFAIIVKLSKKLGVLPIFIPGPSHYFLPVDLLIAIIKKELKVFDEKQFKIINIIGKDLIPFSEVALTISRGVNPTVKFLYIPTKYIRFLIKYLFFNPGFLKTKMKFFYDTVYSVSEKIPKVVAESDVRSMKFNY